jgi:hypothetical protein
VDDQSEVVAALGSLARGDVAGARSAAESAPGLLAAALAQFLSSAPAAGGPEHIRYLAETYERGLAEYDAAHVRRPMAGYRLGSDRGSPNHGSRLFSKWLMAQIRSPARVRTIRPVPCRMPVGARR